MRNLLIAILLFICMSCTTTRYIDKEVPIETVRTDELILSGFIWKDMSVWLSSENQFNYKAAYDLAVQTNGANLPQVFKFGDTLNPIYYKFETVEDIADFYTKASTYINQVLAVGWAKKDNINWDDYKYKQ